MMFALAVALVACVWTPGVVHAQNDSLVLPNGGKNLHPYTAEAQEYIVLAHNLARGVMTLTEAANMRKLRWDDSLAIEASELVDSCDLKHENKNDKYGQNTIVGGYYVTKNAVDSWLGLWLGQSIVNDIIGDLALFKSNRKSSLLFAETYLVGCASNLCNEVLFTACNYYVNPKTEPSKPTTPPKTTKPPKPTKPTKPTTPTWPSWPMWPFGSGKPSGQGKPSGPGRPYGAGKPTGPVKPTAETNLEYIPGKPCSKCPSIAPLCDSTGRLCTIEEDNDSNDSADPSSTQADDSTAADADDSNDANASVIQRHPTAAAPTPSVSVSRCRSDIR
ncbi:hypothetical protein Poli38472_003802 [Pythium oligandrum]|uniref:SCP domain-containing protein n=1 Tax=Pythium oligandrum TaxID=41045 RepID=A0A8K1CM35_PYTOL|nr:hypothetical protein Poli38472_003802 [Pythium oligandrum]|eukprot:TMW66037.1 hypothetical protein Poli38472_003802 [Pythium oligandrum]